MNQTSDLGARRKNPRSKDEINNKLNQSLPGIEPGPYWWEGSALTNVPPQLGETKKFIVVTSSVCCGVRSIKDRNSNPLTRYDQEIKHEILHEGALLKFL